MIIGAATFGSLPAAKAMDVEVARHSSMGPVLLSFMANLPVAMIVETRRALKYVERCLRGRPPEIIMPLS